MPLLNDERSQSRGIKASAVLTDRDPKNYAPPCDHDDGELRTLAAGSGKQFRFQCLTCGRKGNSIRHDHWLIASLKTDPPPADDGISQRWWESESERRKAEWAAQRAEKDAEWWTNYDAYLLSPAWRRRAQKVLTRDRGLCQADLDGCERRATQVHHLTYAHVGEEPLFELIAICAACHRRLTAIDREKRQAA